MFSLETSIGCGYQKNIKKRFMQCPQDFYYQQLEDAAAPKDTRKSHS